VIELGCWEILIMIPCLLIDLSPAWFAFTKSTRVRWMLVIGWWAFGLLLVSWNPHRIGDPPSPIALIGYPIGIVVGGIFWAAIYQAIGWFCVRVWRFFRKSKVNQKCQKYAENQRILTQNDLFRL